MFYRSLIKLIEQVNQPLVYKFAYLYTFIFCKLCQSVPVKFALPLSPVKVMGLSFANPIGLAAGFDRQGKLLPYLENTGFGFIEVGTINIDLDYKAIEPIINLEKAAKQQGYHKQRWGINLGSLRETLDEYSVADYAKGMELFWHHADYLVINLSRPGSPVRELEPNIEELNRFLNDIKQHHRQLTFSHGTHVPMVVKIAVDHNNEAIADLLLLIEFHDFDAVIIAFENWPDSNDIIDYIHTIKKDVKLLPFIVVGGIRTMTDAKMILDAGASLVQLYTSLVQYGPWHTRKAISRLR